MFMRLCSAICLRTDGHGFEAGPGKRSNHGVREVELRFPQCRQIFPDVPCRLACISVQLFPGESSWSEDDEGEGEDTERTDQFCSVWTTSSCVPTY